MYVLIKNLFNVHILQTLQETLTCGIAFLHEGLSETEIKVTEQLFTSGAIQVQYHSNDDDIPC